MSSDPATERRIIKTPRAPKLPSSISSFFFFSFLPLLHSFRLLPSSPSSPRKKKKKRKTGTQTLLHSQIINGTRQQKCILGRCRGLRQRDLPVTGPLGKIYTSRGTHRSHWLCCAICLFFICRIFLFFSFFLGSWMIPVFIWLLPDSLPPQPHKNTKG